MAREPEVWRVAVGYDRYEVSSRGRVRNLSTGAVLKPHPTRCGHGYRRVHLTLEAGAARYVRVHRLVCLTFHGPPPSALESEVAHLNDRPGDNRAANLAWVSRTVNEKHKATKPRRKVRVLTEKKVRAIWADLQAGASALIVARKHRVSWPVVRDIRTGRSWAKLTGLTPTRRERLAPEGMASAGGDA